MHPIRPILLIYCTLIYTTLFLLISKHSFRPPAASRCGATAGKSAGKHAGKSAGNPAGKAAGATAGVPAGSLVRVERSEGRGHILVSTSAVSPGQVVLAEYPCVTGDMDTVQYSTVQYSTVQSL